MPEGIICLSIVPVRQEPSGKSTMVNQLLFGDTVAILEEYNDWLKISGFTDNYEGWCESSQVEWLASPLTKSNSQLVNDITATIKGPDCDITVVYGSSLRFSNDEKRLMSFNNTNYFHIEGEVRKAFDLKGSNVVASAMKLLGAPYLWGGRSPFGIDCSGLIQIAFKMVGLDLPRDAWQQAEFTNNFVDLIGEAQPGDVAFFDNDEGKIIHTGILTGQGQIVHANGKVKIDPIDHYGIFNKKTGGYSHRLRWIKRFI